jgi:hypothetical protein
VIFRFSISQTDFPLLEQSRCCVTKRMHPFELNPTSAFTLLGTFFIYLWTRPPRWTLIPVLIIAVCMRIWCIRLNGGLGDYYGVSWISWGAFLGIGSLMVLAVQVMRSKAPAKKSYLRTFYAGSIFPMLGVLEGNAHLLGIWLRPRTYDSLLLFFDGTLGFSTSFVLGHLLRRSPLAWNLTTIVYYALPLAVCLVYASSRVRGYQPVPVLTLFLIFTTFGFAVYLIYPAVGPSHAFTAVYPGAPPSLAQMVLQPMAVPDAPRNCMPSLHLGAALLVWWNSRFWPRWGRALAASFSLATAFATMALGEHYLADLIVAFPFALLFQAAWTTSVPWSARVRRNSFYFGIVATILWMLLLRFGVQFFEVSRVIPWTLLVATIAWSIVLERNLAAAALSSKARTVGQT